MEWTSGLRDHVIEIFGEHIAPCDPIVIPFVPDIKAVGDLFGGEDVGDTFAFLGFFPLAVTCGEQDKTLAELLELWAFLEVGEEVKGRREIEIEAVLAFGPALDIEGSAHTDGA